MTNEEAKTFLDNLKVCIEEHPIVADWLVEIADRKTKNSSEKPNNCKTEPRKEQYFCGKCRYLYRDFKYGLSCYRLMDNEPCKYEERKTEPTISKMEQVDKDINVRSKTEQTEIKGSKRLLKGSDEPQTERELEQARDALKRMAVEKMTALADRLEQTERSE